MRAVGIRPRISGQSDVTSQTQKLRDSLFDFCKYLIPDISGIRTLRTVDGSVVHIWAQAQLGDIQILHHLRY